jgi:hypothetical protein
VSGKPGAGVAGEVVGDLLGLLAAGGLDHYSDERLCAARPDQDSTSLAKRCFSQGDLVGEAIGNIRHAFRHSDVDQNLRQRGHCPTGEISERAARSSHCVKQNDGREKAVAGRGVIGKDDVARLLTAQRMVAGGECLEYVAISDGGLDYIDTRIAHCQPETEIGHDRHDNRVITELSQSSQVTGRDGNDVIAIDDCAGVIDRDQSIGITVESDTDICSMF